MLSRYFAYKAFSIIMYFHHKFRITKNRYLAGFSIIVLVLAFIRLIFPSVAEYKTMAESSAADSVSVVNEAEGKSGKPVCIAVANINHIPDAVPDASQHKSHYNCRRRDMGQALGQRIRISQRF